MESSHPRGAAPVTLEGGSVAEMSTVERLKHASEGLFYVQSTHDSRHTMRSEIDALSAREAETISEHAKEIAKHFGIYKQRERNDSGKKDGDFIFMVRAELRGAISRATASLSLGTLPSRSRNSARLRRHFGSQPATLTAEALKHTAPLPLEWTKQRQILRCG